MERAVEGKISLMSNPIAFENSLPLCCAARVGAWIRGIRGGKYAAENATDATRALPSTARSMMVGRVLMMMVNCTFGKPAHAVPFGKRPPAPRNPKGKPGRPFAGAHVGGAMVGRAFLVLTGACQFGHGVGGFTTNFVHLFSSTKEPRKPSYPVTQAAALTAHHDPRQAWGVLRARRVDGPSFKRLSSAATWPRNMKGFGG